MPNFLFPTISPEPAVVKPSGPNQSLGTLSNDDDDRSENLAKKVNLSSFKLNRVYLDLPKMSNVGHFSWSWILKDFIQVQKEEGKFMVVCPRPP